VFDAARAIIMAATGQMGSVPPAPSTVEVTPSSDVCAPGEEVTITFRVLDQNDVPMENVTINFTITGQHPQGGVLVTDAAGEATYAYTGTDEGVDTITAVVDYTIPRGLQWGLLGCQSLVMTETAPGSEIGIGTKVWDITVPAQTSTWGRIKVSFQDR
jgi:hypothetical protein